jgi:DNA-binding Xre family transcriptional regulator
MIKRMGYDWQLRKVMAARGMYQTTDLVGPLLERGISLSREQVYRLVTQTPQRLSLDVLAAICDILDCGPQDLVEIKPVRVQVAKPATSGSRKAVSGESPRTVIRRPGSTSI